MFRVDDDLADSSFETQNRETLAAQKTRNPARSGSYRGVSSRDRRANSLPNMRRELRFSPVTAMRSNSLRNWIDSFGVLLPADVARELAHHPVPRGTPNSPAELEPNFDSTPAIPPRSPRRPEREFSSGARENLEPAGEGQHVTSFMAGFSGETEC